MKKTGKKFIVTGAAAVLAASMLAGCASNSANATVATFDGEKVPLKLANLMLRYNQASTETYLGALFGDGSIWDTDLTGSGVGYGVTFKAQILEELKDMLTYEKHMGDYSVELTDEEKAAITAAAEQFLAENDAAALKAMMADQENVERLLTLTTIQNKVQTAVKNEADSSVTDEEAAQSSVEYVLFSTAGTTDEDGNTVELTDEEKEAVKAQAQELIDAVTGGKEMAEALAEIDEEKSVSNASYSTNNEDDGIYITELDTAARTLTEDGAVYAEPIEAESGYYVLQMKSVHDEEASEEQKESLAEEKKNNYLNEKLTEWAPEFTVDEKVWSKVTFYDAYTLVQETEAETEGTEAAESETEAEETEAAESETAAE
ncbi:MAG: peptidyl-prolyl cis-trans isomerase [Eubacteriales bacterium]|nr:peptidyl-prolyl cis-trans isomerase [Eubacteriales bacterium]